MKILVTGGHRPYRVQPCQKVTGKRDTTSAASSIRGMSIVSDDGMETDRVETVLATYGNTKMSKKPLMA